MKAGKMANRPRLFCQYNEYTSWTLCLPWVKREIIPDSNGAYPEKRTWGPGNRLFFGAPASISCIVFFMFSNPIGKHMFFRIQLQNPIEFLQLPFGLYIRQVSRMFLTYPLRLGTHNCPMYSKVFA